MKGTFGEIIASETPTLIDFHAVWCQPCHMLSPILKNISKEYGSKLTVIKIDVDKNKKLAARFKIQGVPTVAIFKSGKLVWRQSGVLQPNQYKKVIDQYV